MLLAAKVETLVDDADEQTILNSPPIDPIGVKDSSKPSELSATTHIHAGPSRSAPQPENFLKQASRGDLDWSYTSRCVRRWSPNSLLTHLCSHAFSVPPKDTKLSFTFVNINVFSQDGDDPETVSLPQAYRLPLLMVAKYLWETVHFALSGGQEEWMAQTTNIFHISRLCENLFAGARVKTAKGGMEMGWRCLMFDRFLTRFYNHWTQNDPASNESFWKEHGAEGYDKDVLKHDWKRWSLRGLNGIRLTDQEVSWGLSADQFRKTLVLNRDSQTWTLEGKTLSFITSDEGPAWSSVSELTDVDFGEDDEEVKPSLDMLGSILPPSATRKEHSSSFPSAKRLRFPHRSSAVHLLPRKVPDQARLSTLRKSARTPSALASLSSIASPNSAIRQTTSLPEAGPSQNISSSNSMQTHIHPSRSKEGLVVLIKRRAPVTQAESLEQSSNLSTHAERSDAPSVIDLTQPSPPSNLSKRRSRPSPRKKEMESDAARRLKRRKMDEFDIGSGQETPIQASTHFVPYTATNASKPNGVPYTQRASFLHEVSVQTTPTIPIAIEQGTQTDICIGSEMNIDRDVMIPDSTSMPAATTATTTTSDIAIQTELVPLRDVNSLKNFQKVNGIMEGCTTEMQNDLSLVVDNLVSSRLVSLMRALKQSSEPTPASGSGTDSSSPTLCENSALVLTNRGASGTDRNLINGLFDEMRLLREEAHSREQRTQEEMRALRHLHNAEVDSLRRRLAYLESQSHEQPVKGCDTRRAAAEPSYRSGQTHYSNRTTIPPRLGDKQHHFPDDEMPSASNAGSLRSPDPPVPEPFSNGNGFSGRLFSTNRSRNDMEQDSPLPSKTQRKSHIIAFSRPSAIG